MVVIEAKNLEVQLGERRILKKVDLQVRQGETFALMGASGSGKSTLLKALVGLVPAKSGEVRLFGETISRASFSRLVALRKRVGMVFQENALFDSMTVFENISFFLREVKGLLPREVKPVVAELLERLRLGPIGRLFPAELSGGMKKRVAIARAVAHDPDLILYDDPTAGLDPITSEVIAELMAELGQTRERTRARAAVVVSNYLPLVEKVADRVGLLHEGRIIELGPPSELRESERREVREFLDTRGEED